MDLAIYSALSRATALKSELSVIANNIANISTTGFRKEGLTFSEYISRQDRNAHSISMTDAGARFIDATQGVLNKTGGALDFAIEGDGYFHLQGPDGNLLSRAGSFSRSPEGEIVTPEGYQLLDEGGAPILLPLDATEITLASDGSLTADGAPIAAVGLVRPLDAKGMERMGENAFTSVGTIEPADGATVHQGFLESSNVNPLEEVARMIEVQRRYEAAKSFADREHQRITSVLETLGR
ncbi:MAG: flagellar hook-basal body complex protein [Pseudomonadota bacterium]